MKLHVKWVQQGTYGLPNKVWQYGCWGLFKGNGDLFVIPTVYGNNRHLKKQLEEVARLWNRKDEVSLSDLDRMLEEFP